MDRTQIGIVLGAFLALLIVEIIAGRHKGIYKKNDYIVNGLCSTIVAATTQPFASIVISIILAFVIPGYVGLLSDISFWIAFPALILCADFVFYWFHRLSHQSVKPGPFQWLWKLHRTHHSGSYVNVILLYRTHPIWPFVTPMSWIFGLGIYLGQAPAVASALFLYSLWNLVTHSNFRWDDKIRQHRALGPIFYALEHVLVSPGIHHTHHGYGRDGAPYRNFGLLLSVYDWVFGTLHIPRGRPHRYGLPGSNAHWTEEVFYPLFRNTSSDA